MLKRIVELIRIGYFVQTMTFFRHKLLFRLLAITLIAAIIPLLVATIIILTKSYNSVNANVNNRLSSQIFHVSNYLNENIIIPLERISDVLILDLTQSDSSNVDFISKFPAIDNAIVSIAVIEENSNEITTIYGESVFNSMIASQNILSELEQSKTVFMVESADELSAKYLVYGRRLDPKRALVITLQENTISNYLRDFYKTREIEDNLALIDMNRQETYFYETGKEDVNDYPMDSAFSNLTVQPLELFEYENSTDEKILACFLDLSTFPNWRIIAEVSEDLAYAPVREIRNTFLLLLSVGLLLTLFGTYYYWKKITGPLDRFARSATEIARGDFKQKVQVDSDDEIGRLSKIFNYMVFELGRLNEMNLNKIITEKNKTQAIIKNIADGVIVTDNYDRIVTLNVATEKWFKISESEIIEKPISMVIHIPDLIQFLEEMKSNQTENFYTRELVIKLPGNTKDSIFKAKATRIFSEEKFMGVVTILRDITQEKEIDRMKTELVSIVAHELRSPLAAISGFAEILGSIGPTKDQVEEYSNIIREEAERLAELVSKYLDLTKIEAGRMDFVPAFFQIKEVFDANLYLVSAQAEKKNINLDINFANEDLEVYFDEKMMSEVIVNLLSNAIKYSPENSTIRVKVLENSKNVDILVSDSGYGIDKNHLPHIFDKFYRIKDDVRIQDEKGTGLGLSLVKEIVELHGGTITVASKMNEGTTFKIVLPRKDPATVWQQ